MYINSKYYFIFSPFKYAVIIIGILELFKTVIPQEIYRRIYVRNEKQYRNFIDNTLTWGMLRPFPLSKSNKLVPMEKLRCRNKTTVTSECPRVYWPVCATNGVTYFNECVFNCAVIYNKPKRPKDSPIEVARYGQCIIYRRNNIVVTNVTMPKEWGYINDTDSFNVADLETALLEEISNNNNTLSTMSNETYDNRTVFNV